MEVPAPFAGAIQNLLVESGEKLKIGQVILTYGVASDPPKQAEKQQSEKKTDKDAKKPELSKVLPPVMAFRLLQSRRRPRFGCWRGNSASTCTKCKGAVLPAGSWSRTSRAVSAWGASLPRLAQDARAGLRQAGNPRQAARSTPQDRRTHGLVEAHDPALHLCR